MRLSELYYEDQIEDYSLVVANNGQNSFLCSIYKNSAGIMMDTHEVSELTEGIAYVINKVIDEFESK